MARRRTVSSLLSSDILKYVVSRGYTQADIAQMLDVTEGFISLVKSQERSLTLDHVEALADGIQMPLGELFIQATTPTNPSKKHAEMFERTASIIRLGDEARAAIRRHQQVKK